MVLSVNRRRIRVLFITSEECEPCLEIKNQVREFARVNNLIFQEADAKDIANTRDEAVNAPQVCLIDDETSSTIKCLEGTEAIEKGLSKLFP